MRWHTGRSGIAWALILAVTSGYILFFIYSGFAITLKRRRARPKNKFKATEADIVILVGSENGSTFRFADAVCSRLIEHGRKVFLTDLDNYTSFPSADYLIIMSSTYGQGEPPSNAKRIAEKLAQYPQQRNIHYTVVGFGSRSYPHFCKFAFDIDKLLQEQPWAKALFPVYTVNDQSPQDFSDWLSEWVGRTGYHMLLPRELLTPDTRKLTPLRVIDKSALNEENTFNIRLNGKRLKDLVSGDLLAIYPKDDHRERLYSVGKVDGQIQLSIKLHEHGIGSGHLHALQIGDVLKARLMKNGHFRVPKNAKALILISNGTGIAPFLGMISENKRKIPIRLYCGFRTQSAFDLHRFFLEEQLAKGKLAGLHLALSREAEKEYVSHQLLKNKEMVWHTVKNDGVIMICGSLSMQRDVMAVLEDICNYEGTHSVASLIDQGRILTDCY